MKYFTLVLIVLLLSVSGCGKEITQDSVKPSCPDKPTVCGQYDLYGPECYNYETYKQLGYDVSEDAATCNLGHITDLDM